MSETLAEPLVIQSHTGPYTVEFDDQALAHINAGVPDRAHFVIDERVASLYSDSLGDVLSSRSVLLIEASEQTKSLDRFPAYVEHLVSCGVRRGDVLWAIGGGVIQDIVCFLAATLLRGLEWRFLPTTLLAQADSCIGSKSSINVGAIKNILGTFTPPTRVVISTPVLKTLEGVDLRSGIGEMLKVHAIDGPESFERIAAEYESLLEDRDTLMHYIRASLEIKRGIIELDEFDRGPRNVMNYGHSFGHAIESATRFSIPHGIAVTIGMDMANFVASGLELAPRAHFDRMHPTLAANFSGFASHAIPVEETLTALTKDKKNRGAKLRLVLPDQDGCVRLVDQSLDQQFRTLCAEYLDGARAS